MEEDRVGIKQSWAQMLAAGKTRRGITFCALYDAERWLELFEHGFTKTPVKAANAEQYFLRMTGHEPVVFYPCA